MIRLFNLHKSYPSRGVVLQDLDLQVEHGEFVMLCGASGAGKTTLLRIIMASEQPDSGQVMVAGRNLAKLKRSSIPYLRRNIGVIFQDFKLLGPQSVVDNVAMPLRICGLHGRRLLERTEEVLALVGLIEKAQSRCDTLSGGEQQRVALARALAAQPAILLADEPTGNLDPEATAEVLALIRFAHRRGLTVVLATHDPQVIEAGQADRILELRGGRFVRDDVRSGVQVSVTEAQDGTVQEVSLVV